MAGPAQPLVLSPTAIAAQPVTAVADNRGRFSYTSLFSAPETRSKDLTAGIAVLAPRTGRLCAHHHPQTEIYHVLAGTGVVTIDGRETAVEAGSAVFIPGGATHGIRNPGAEELRWFYVFPTHGFADVVYTYLDGAEAGGGSGTGTGMGTT